MQGAAADRFVPQEWSQGVNLLLWKSFRGQGGEELEVRAEQDPSLVQAVKK